MNRQYIVQMLMISVIPQPVYMNSQQLFPQSNDTIRTDQEDIENDDDLKTPTVEELSFPGNVESNQKVINKITNIPLFQTLNLNEEVRK